MYPNRAHFWLTAGLICGTLAATPAQADNWDVSASFDVTGAFTDNAFLAGDDEPRDSDFLITVAPNMSVRGEGARLSANLDATLSRSHSLWATRGGKTSAGLLGNGRAEWLEDFAVLDAQLSVADHTVKPNLPSSPSSSGGRTNRSTVYAMNLSQSFRNRISDLANTQVLLRYSPTFVETTEISDSYTLLAQASLNSGSWFQRFRWGVDATQSETTRQNSLSPLEKRSLNSNYTLALARSVSAIGSVGYEEIKDGTLDGPPDGMIWSGGLEVRPGRRTFVRASYGKRYDTDAIDFEGRYEYSPRTSIRATYGQSLETSLTSITNDLRFLGADENGKFIDTRTGLPFNPEGAAFGLQNATFLVKRFGASARIGGRRSNLSLRGGWESRDTDQNNLLGDENADQIKRHAGLSYTRSLSRRTESALNLGYSRTKFDTDAQRIDDRYDSSLSVTYAVAENVRLTGGLGYVLRDSSDVGSSYRETSGFVRFTRDF